MDSLWALSELSSALCMKQFETEMKDALRATQLHSKTVKEKYFSVSLPNAAWCVCLTVSECVLINEQGVHAVSLDNVSDWD